VLLALVLAAACRHEKTAQGRSLPAGDAVWLSEGLGEDPAATDEVLARGGLARVFLPAVHVRREAGAWKAAGIPLPARPAAAPPVVLVVEADADSAAISVGAEDAAAAAIAEGLKGVLAKGGTTGRIEGVHLDLPLEEATAESFGRVATRVRSLLPSPLFLTCSLRFSPTPKKRDEVLKSLAAIDGFVAFVFGVGALTDPMTADSLGKPWWAGYVPGATAVWSDSAGNPRGRLSEKYLRALTDDSRVPLGHDLVLQQEGAEGFLFRPPVSVDVAGVRLSAGDQVAFRQPLVSDLLQRLGSDLVGRKLLRGRLVVLDGRSDSERIFTLAALSDVLLGRPLLPDLRVEFAADATGLRVSAENRSAHSSIVSHTANWVEVDVPSGHIRDVQPGGFDRYEVFDADGRPVTPGRATRVRLYETLVAPQEKIEAATILLWGRPAEGCCRFRQHVLASSGPEVAGDWTAPPAPPTPPPKSRAKPKRR